jgi:hypothetical protein
VDEIGARGSDTSNLVDNGEDAANANCIAYIVKGIKEGYPKAGREREEGAT